MVTVPQPAPLMVRAVVEQHEEDRREDGRLHRLLRCLGDLVYDSLLKAAEPAGIKVVANERYARADSR